MARRKWPSLKRSRWSRHSVRTEFTQRSEIAFARGALKGVRTCSMLRCCRRAEIVAAIDPKRSIRLIAEPSTQQSDRGSLLRAEFLYWRAAPQKGRTASGTRLFECKRSHRPIYSIHAVSGNLAIPMMAVDYGGDACSWRRSRQKPQIPISGVRLGFVFDPRAGSQQPSAGRAPEASGESAVHHSCGARDVIARTNRHANAFDATSAASRASQ